MPSYTKKGEEVGGVFITGKKKEASFLINNWGFTERGYIFS